MNGHFIADLHTGPLHALIWTSRCHAWPHEPVYQLRAWRLFRPAQYPPRLLDKALAGVK